MANGVVMENETEHQPVSIATTSAGQQQTSSVKCETLHKKYFETVTVTPSPSENNVDQSSHDNDPPTTAESPPTDAQNVAIETPQFQNSCHNDKKHYQTSSTISNASKSTSVPDKSYNESFVPPSGSSIVSAISSSQSSEQAAETSTSVKESLVNVSRASPPLETCFPVQPVIIVEAGKKVEKVCVAVSPPTERIKKKGIKTTPLIKTTLRPVGCKPKSPLVARVSKPAVAIKTTVNVDTKLLIDKSKHKVSTDSKKVTDKSKGKVSGEAKLVREKSKEKVTSDTKLVRDKSKEKVTANTKIVRDKSKEKITANTKLVRDKSVEKVTAETKTVTTRLKESIDITKETDREPSEISAIEKNPEKDCVSCLEIKPEICLENCEDKETFENKIQEIFVEEEDQVNESYKRNSELSVIDEEISVADLNLSYCVVRDQLNLDDCETASDSIRVNVDTDSVNTLTDPIDEDFCTQYSIPESEEDPSDSKGKSEGKSKCNSDSPISNDSAADTEADVLDIDVDIDDPKVLEACYNTDLSNGVDSNVVDLRTELRDARINEIRAKSSSLNRKSHEDRSLLHESGSRISILRNWNENLRSFYGKNRSFDSEHSSIASFYSIDNGNCEPNLGSKSRKLKWTPRVLSETRNSSTHSGTFSDCASFYTADTYGTFYSARSFQLDSCDNFQTCEDFQQLDLPPRSKLSKAKEALVRGKDFVKSKFENYRKRLPALRRSDPTEDQSKGLCHHTCGFSCVHLGKEISQYSLPDISSAKGDYPDNLDVIKGDNCELSNLDYHDGGGAVSMPDLSNECRAMNDGIMENTVDHQLADAGKVNGIADADSTPEKDCEESEPTVKMGTVARETTEAEDDDMPVGTEAISIPRDQQIAENGETGDRPANKRLRWVSAIEKTQGTSLGSSFTSNSSVEQLLHQREMDPETLLSDLGFGADPNIEDPMGRIPDRFITNPCAAQGINLQQFLVSHPELHHLLPVLEKTMTSTDSSSGSENQSAPLVKKGSMHRQHTFSGVVHGMKFIREVQAPAAPAPDDEDKRISQIPSVLDFPNRKALARQGFYGNDYMLRKKEQDVDGEKAKMSRSLSAAQRRKQFLHSCKSKSKNWSLTDDAEADDNTKDGGPSDANEETNITRPNMNLNSFDRGLLLRSFSERFSSDSSLESSDSYGDDRRELFRQHSISNLRRQYQETIRRSMEGEYPVFEGPPHSVDTLKANSISEARRKQVTRLMSSEEDDGDYFAHVRQSSVKDNKQSLLTKAQNSTQSVASPGSPNDLKFSFESSLNDGESEFGFSSHPKAPKNLLSSQTTDSNVSVIIEEEVFDEQGENSGAVTEPGTNSGGLEPPSLVLRSDSCNTLVSQDTAENEHLEGEVTPRPGDNLHGVVSPEEPVKNQLNLFRDDLSESTGSSRTLIPSYDNTDEMTPYLGSDEEEGDLVKGQRSKRSPHGAKDSLSPGGLGLPQESFELEEISSAEDLNGNTVQLKAQDRRGQMEKSASTHSDSSGFADLDPLGETTQNSLTDIPKETFTTTSAKPKLTKQRTMRDENQTSTVNNFTDGYHDDKNTHDALSPIEADNMERQIISEQRAMIEKVMTPSIEQTKSLYVCRRQPSQPENETMQQENENPELASISYLGSQKQNDKSIVYTINVPLVETLDHKKPAKQPKRFVSKVNLQVVTPKGSIDKESIVSDKSDSSHIIQIGAVQHVEIGKSTDNKPSIHSELNPDTQERPSVTPDIQVQGQRLEIPADGLTLNQIHASNHTLLLKSQLRSKQKAKEALVSSTNQTADWLLSNSCQSLYPDTRHKYGNRYLQLKYGQPLWASTPDLKKPQVDTTSQLKSKMSYFKDSNQSQSLDAGTVDENDNCYHDNTEYKGENQLSVQNTGLPALHQQRSADAYIDSTKQRLAERRSSGPAFSDESVDVPRHTHMGSSASIPEDHMQYIKLSRLVNGPSLLMSSETKMPIMRFTPNLRMKNWVDPPEMPHLEDETRLMQYAVHRYKVEMSVMETMLANLCQQSQTEMGPDDQEDIEELQFLWNEVRKEVDKMEILLAERLKSLKAGNDSYSPLDALQIVQAMIDLLREQLYHQQMCINKDAHLQTDDIDDMTSNMSVSGVSMRSTSDNSAFFSDLSQQMSEVKDTVSRSQEIQKQTLHETFSELKSNLLSDLKGELSAGSNPKMLQLQLQARDNEIQRLRMELLLQNVESGKTRKKLTLESDV